MMLKNVNEYIKEKIKKTACFFRKNPNLLLCEADMQCHLFRFIYEDIEKLNNYNVYSELHWYSDRSKLENRADISIVKLSNIDIMKENGSFTIYDRPSNFILELKYNSSKKVLRKSISKGVLIDINKVNDLVNINDYLSGYVVLFNRSDLKYDMTLSENSLNSKCQFIEEKI